MIARVAHRFLVFATCLPVLALVGLVSGCVAPADRYEASANARRYPLNGVVRAVKKADRTLTIAHDEIEGLMDAMTMDFVVRDVWVLDVAGVGDRVGATLVLDGARSWIEDVAITKADSLTPEAAAPDSGHVAPGTALPDVELLDQDGRAVSPATYQGTYAVYTFIYTRCPLPEYCPLMMRRLDEIGARLTAEGRREDVWLLAVTLDPEHDVPAVLKAYGDRMLADVPGGRYSRTALLTGTPDAIRQLATTFQLTYEADGNEIVHGLRTAVVDPEGKVVRVFSGNEWDATDVVELLAGR